jgi:alpha-N-arabinofuranosidase
MNRLVVLADCGKQVISRHIYGHFAEHLGRCIYDGLWVGEDSSIPNTRGFRNDVVAALRKLNIPNLRWPGGCFADTYHWMDGIGPREKRPSIVNVHWGGVTENNHVGTHEFLNLCQQLSSPTSVCEPYIAGNVGSGTVREMAEWIEYITMPGESPMAKLRRANGRQEPWSLTYWGVGNENWGCGGNMRPQYYADLYRHYASYCRHFTPGARLYKVACGYWEDWNHVILQECHRFMDGLSVHYYTVPGPWQKKGAATGFTLEEWQITLKKAADIEGFIVRTKGQMDRFDPQKRIGIFMDEWGTWFDVEPGTNPGFLYQQNTIRDALVAGLSLNIFHKHADRMHMANIAQTVNVLQAMALTEGAKMLLTPTYHVFEMMKGNQGATLLPSELDCGDYGEAPNTLPQLSASASRGTDGILRISLVNLHHADAADLSIDLHGARPREVRGRVLTGETMDAHNTFDHPDAIRPVAFNDAKPAGAGVQVTLPPRSVVVLELT